MHRLNILRARYSSCVYDTRRNGLGIIIMDVTTIFYKNSEKDRNETYF